MIYLFSEARKDTYKSTELINSHKIAVNMKKKGFLASFILGGALYAVFLIS